MRKPRSLIPVAVVCLCMIAVNPAQEHDNPPGKVEGVPCTIDESLSLWLSLESVDRTIGRLDRERRKLADKLVSTQKRIDVLTRVEQGDELDLAELRALADAREEGHELLQSSYAELQRRLSDVEKTLERRRDQQAMLETRLDDLLSAPRERSISP